MKAAIVAFPVGAHVLIRDDSDDVWVKAFEIAAALARAGHRPEVGRIVDPREDKYVGVRVVLIVDRTVRDYVKLTDTLRAVAEQCGVEIVDA
jgi:hypothetical protein